MSQSLFVSEIGDRMELEFIQNWKKFDLNCQPLLVAVSTGVDSMVLLDLLQHLPADLRPQITVGYVDHRLRKQSKDETKFIQEYCRHHRLPLKIGVWDADQHPQHGIEKAARNFRYAFFSETMAELKISTLATAHHADDLAETFLMKLLRGGELSQLVGIAPCRSMGQGRQVIRPLLPYSKQQLYDYARQHQLTFFEDETNQDDDVLRNRIRHHIIPQLKQENPRFLDHVRSYTQQLRSTLKVNQQILQQQLTQLLEDDRVSLPAWLQLDAAMRRAVLKEYLIQHGVPLHQRQFAEVSSFLENRQKPQGTSQLDAKRAVVKEYMHFYLISREKAFEKVSNQSFLIQGETPASTATFELALNHHEQRDADEQLRFSRLPAGLALRHRLPGDWLRIREGTKKLTRFLIDKKISQRERQALWVIADEKQEVYALFGDQPNSMIYLSQPVENATIRYIVAIKYRKR